MTKLFEKLAQLEVNLNKVESVLGLPQRRFLLARNQLQGKLPEDTLISSHITNVSPRLVGLPVGNVTIKASYYQVEIPRVYPLSTFISPTKARVSFIIDPPLDSTGAVVYSNQVTKSIEGGIPCKLIHLMDSDPIVFSLILAKETD
jgi:hypothetical protein